MNGKQAKRLRRAAMGLGVSLAQSGKEIAKDGYVVKTHKKTNYSASSISSDPADQREAPPQALPAYQLLVRRDSVKGIYKQLKRGA